MQKKSYKSLKFLLGAAALTMAVGLTGNNANATNGMNLEGYGPEALSMGGAAFAYDNGTAATMNNPATMGLMAEGHRLDLAFGFLAPDVDTRLTGMPSAHSEAELFMMPAFGWAKKKDNFTYGVGVFGQGGMGTEFGANSFLAAGSGELVRTEVGVGRAMIPVSYNVNDRLTIGGSADFVWAGMDVRMAMSGAQFGDMVAALGGTQSQGSASGTMVDGMVGMIMGGAMNPAGPVNWARFDFSNGSDFTGEAKGYGLAGKIGMVYNLTPQLTMGATYHSRTNLSDMDTDDATVTMSANVDPGAMSGAPTGTYTAMSIPVKGKMSVQDFQWPETYGIGFAFQANDKLMLAADVKRIMWSNVMQAFTMKFTALPAAQQSGMAAGFGGAEMVASLDQKWDDQTVIAFGGAYRATDAITVRAGYNHSSNPVPNTYLNALFPAIVESHFTAGLGYKLSDSSCFDLAISKALSTSAANIGSTVISDHQQWSGQLMYTYRY